MQTSDFFYDLPERLIAQRPLADRAASRLLVLTERGERADRKFSDIGEYLRPGDLLVVNDTQVIPARLFGRKSTGGKVEVMLERIISEDTALAHVRASKSPKPGAKILLGNNVELKVIGRQDELFELQLNAGNWLTLLQSQGHVPLPPYIQRDDNAEDLQRYQTVYAAKPGAVAAPTAGLHFTKELLQSLQTQGIEIAQVTLHVGAGTFQPVRVDNIAEHIMHSEQLFVSEQVCDQVQACKQRGGRVVAVGTTSVRSLESAAASGKIAPFSGDTRLFITPGYKFRVVDALITNFHLPESTLMMLVSALGGYEPVMAAYRHAVAENYRFFSYGDAMFIEKRNPDAI